jgi:putative membrane protein
MGGLVMRWFASAGAIAVVAWLLPGISAGAGTRGVMTVLVTALVLGLVNAIVKPVLQLLTCPLVLLTLGLFLFVINAAMLLLASALTRAVGFDFHVDGLWNALVGSILISIVTWFLTLFVGKQDRHEKRAS